MGRKFFRTPRAFTLVELLVTLTILALLATILFRVLGHTSDIWRRNRSRVEAFQAARAGFERLTRQLSQATLDTYLDYYSSSDESRTDWARKGGNVVSGDFPVEKYDWASDLHFVMGDASDLISSASGDTPTHAVFFVSPAGLVGSNSPQYRGLNRLLNAMGFYIEYLSDDSEIPPFLRGRVPQRSRYRLVEMNQPSEELSIYEESFSKPYNWFNEAITPPDNTNPSTFILADNVIALILRPRVSTADSTSSVGAAVESSYAFDSKGYLNGGNSLVKNQLPPLVQVTMVTIDEASAERYERMHGSGTPNFIPSGLFNNPASFESDLEELERHLADLKLNYRILTTDVSLRGAKTTLN
jgi:Verrucomicrobium spinosum paralogous family TIGR02599